MSEDQFAVWWAAMSGEIGADSQEFMDLLKALEEEAIKHKPDVDAADPVIEYLEEKVHDVKPMQL